MLKNLFPATKLKLTVLSTLTLAASSVFALKTVWSAFSHLGMLESGAGGRSTWSSSPKEPRMANMLLLLQAFLTPRERNKETRDQTKDASYSTAMSASHTENDNHNSYEYDWTATILEASSKSSGRNSSSSSNKQHARQKDRQLTTALPSYQLIQA